jgi:hypothetical protein
MKTDGPYSPGILVNDDETDLKVTDNVSATVNLDYINDLAKVNDVFSRYFQRKLIRCRRCHRWRPRERSGPPTPDARNWFPRLKQFSVIAVK